MITRRSALKTIGAALLAPMVTLRQTVDRERLLSAFCMTDFYSARWDVVEPFAVGSLTYATDCRHIIRAELSSRIEGEKKRIPPVEELWNKMWHPYQFVPFELPPFDSHSLLIPAKEYGGICPMCDDRRVSLGERFPQSMDEEDSLPDYDPDDNTIRDTSCPLCRGRLFVGPCQLNVQGVRMSYSRLKPIAALPNVQVSVAPDAYDNPCILFKADGFQGIAMGLARD